MADLANHIEEDLNWREAELASFKILVSAAQKGSVRERALLRALWALLYAHYEGFCKYAWDLYLDALEELGIVRHACRSRIACFSLEREFKQLRGNLSPESLWDFYTHEFPDLLSQHATFQIKLETQSNLWPDLFRENARKISLPTKMLDANEIRIKTLVARRNDIAHGKKTIVKSLHEYQEYENAVLLVMHELAIAMIEALDQKLFLK